MIYRPFRFVIKERIPLTSKRLHWANSEPVLDIHIYGEMYEQDRITLAKALISRGLNPSEACKLSGLNYHEVTK